MASKKFIDIGANLGDPIFRGIYRGKTKHKDDILDILSRAETVGITGMLITSGMLTEAIENVNFIKETASQNQQSKINFFCTVGVHPTRCNTFKTEAPTPEEHLTQLKTFISENRQFVGAIGECGLDKDRLHFCDLDQQMLGFKLQFSLAKEFNLPLFLHSRNCTQEFMACLPRTEPDTNDYKYKGCVHSFTDSLEDLTTILNDTNFYIGINGCSLKTEQNLNVAKSIPLNRLLLETDCPWCGIKNTHASKKFVKTEFPTSKKFKDNFCVKDRTEPCHIVQVAEVMAELLNVPIEDLCQQVYKNTLDCFPFFDFGE